VSVSDISVTSIARLRYPVLMLIPKVVAVAALLACAPAANAQTPPPSPELPVVVATGEAVVKRAPDRAFVSIAAESRARTSRDAQRLTAEAMTSVLAKLKSAGLPGDAIQTTGYDIQPEFDYANGKQTVRGYVARNSIEVRVDELPKLGDILDIAVGAGATSVAGVRFDLKDRTGAEREALQRAVEDARARASAAAAGAGLKVDRVVKIEEQRASVMPPPRPMVAMRAEAQGPTTPVVAGELEIRATVTLTAAIR
jgi:uncharacterized protein YggE